MDGTCKCTLYTVVQNVQIQRKIKKERKKERSKPANKQTNEERGWCLLLALMISYASGCQPASAVDLGRQRLPHGILCRMFNDFLEY